MRGQGKERVHPETGALVLLRGQRSYQPDRLHEEEKKLDLLDELR